MLYINGFFSTSSTKQWKSFFEFQIRFLIFVWKPIFFQTNSEAWILIKLQCVLYQWIRLNELYKLIESFFQISESFFELVTIFKNNSGVGLGMQGGEAFVLISTRSSYWFPLVLV